MDPKHVERLEGEIKAALIRVILNTGFPLPSHHAVYLMAKAAAAVYETAIETRLRESLARLN